MSDVNQSFTGLTIYRDLGKGYKRTPQHTLQILPPPKKKNIPFRLNGLHFRKIIGYRSLPHWRSHFTGETDEILLLPLRREELMNQGAGKLADSAEELEWLTGGLLPPQFTYKGHLHSG